MQTLVAAVVRVACAVAIGLAGPWAGAPAQAQMKQNWMYASSVPAHEQKPAFPVKDKAIRIVVADPAGNAADAQARAVAPQLAALLGVPVEVDNRPGGGSLLAAQEVLNSLPDGHTLFYAASATLAQTPHVLNTASFDPLNDFAPITVSAPDPLMLLVGWAVPARSVAELIAYGRAHPGQLKFASVGVGSLAHLLGATLAANTGVDLVHVPCASNADCIDALASGRVQLAFDTAPAALRAVQSGQARVLAVAAPQRSPFQPGVPTFKEQGVNDLEVSGFFAWVAPGGVRPETAASLHSAISKSLQHASVQAAFETGAYRAESSTPQELTARLKGAYDAWGGLVRRAGIPKQ